MHEGSRKQSVESAGLLIVKGDGEGSDVSGGAWTGDEGVQDG